MRPLVLALLATALLPFAFAQSPVLTPAPDPVAPAAELSLKDAIVLGVVEGITEFLPISSTGHLIIATRLLGLEAEQPLTGRDGQPLYFKKPSAKHPEGEPLTLKRAADTYNVVIQFGAIAAVALLYWPQLFSMLRGLLGRDTAGLRLLINVLIAFLPAAIIGLLTHDWIEAHLFSVGAVIVAQVAGALLMFYAEFWRRRRAVLTPARAELRDLSPLAAAGIGALQCLALWPGTSRSMTTIVGGFFAGLDPRRSAEFSFVLGFVTLTAASIFKSYKSGAAMIQVFGWSHVLLGGVVAAVTAAICVSFLVSWLTRHGLAAFAWYRLALAAVLAVVFYLCKRGAIMTLDASKRRPLLRPFHHSLARVSTRPPTLQRTHPMANPKRKQSKRRSANRRAANAFIAPEFAKDPTDGTLFRPHRVNPKNGMYRGRQVLNVEV